jgi:hypothetical protein
MTKAVLLAGAAALAFSATAVFAQDTKVKPRTAASIECSKQADAKGLHGKARHSFRNKCKREGAKTAKSRT